MYIISIYHVQHSQLSIKFNILPSGGLLYRTLIVIIDSAVA